MAYEIEKDIDYSDYEKILIRSFPDNLRDADISNRTLLLDCGFASDFDFTENIDK